jgi:hypothetical protein
MHRLMRHLAGAIQTTKPNAFLHNRVASVATLRMVFGIIPECRSASLRNERSASPESPPEEQFAALRQELMFFVCAYLEASSAWSAA